MPNRLPFPSKETALDFYFKLVVPYVTTHALRLQIEPSTIALLNNLLNDWNAIFQSSQDSSTRTKNITTNKNVLKDQLMAGLRKAYSDIPLRAFSSEDRNTLNLPEKKGHRSPPPVPNTQPTGRVDTSNRLRHLIYFFNSSGSKAKPYLSRGCQIWFKIGAKPVDLKEMTYLATAPSSPFLHLFEWEHGGQPVHYWLRWENTKGETGPWGNPVSATLAH